MNNENNGRERDELSETELDTVAGGFNPFSKDDWNKGVQTVGNAVNNVVDSAHSAVTNAGSHAAQGASQAAQEFGNNASKNPVGTAQQFSGLGIAQTLADLTQGKQPGGPKTSPNPLSGQNLFEQAQGTLGGKGPAGNPLQDVLSGKNPLQGKPSPLFGQPEEPSKTKIKEAEEQVKIKQIMEEKQNAELDKLNKMKDQQAKLKEQQEMMQKQQEMEKKAKMQASAPQLSPQDQIAQAVKQATSVLKTPFGKF